MDLQDTASRYHSAMKHCDNLVQVHRDHGGPAQGRRDEEVSINRAVIVVTVAAWQAVIQDMAIAAVDAGQPTAGSPMSRQTYEVISGRTRKEVNDFSTPNAENTRRLLQAAGFDPRPHWTWTQMGGRGVGRIVLQPHDIENRIRGWLSLRHDIAHGHDELTRVHVLEAVRQKVNPSAGWNPSIRLKDAESCMAFFRRVSALTARALGTHLDSPPGTWA